MAGDGIAQAHPAAATAAPAAGRIGRLALRALHAELCCHPKPGLVSREDNGSHRDMTAVTFLRSMRALRHYFPRIAAAGAGGAAFAGLARLGRAAERRMLRATGGANTHRGAIFSLGLLAAAAGWRDQRPAPGRSLGDIVRQCWADDIARALRTPSHGVLVTQRYGVGGARSEAVAGFPHVYEVGLPALRAGRARGWDAGRAALHSLYNLIAVLPDTNLLYRGGTDGLAFAQQTARMFLSEGGVEHPDWQARARSIHHSFIARGLSPGGSADLLAASLFLAALEDAP